MCMSDILNYLLLFRVVGASTISLPNELSVLSNTFRGIHGLTTFSWSESKCIVCRLCEYVCPAQAILIYSGIGVSGRRIHSMYDIDLVKCIYCNMCGVVCPVYAIRELPVVDWLSMNLADHFTSQSELIVNSLIYDI